jgi:hypothetical protein
MATRDDVRAICRSLPSVIAEERRFAFTLVAGSKRRGLAWVWLERVDPRKGRLPNPAVLAIRVADLGAKQTILASDERIFFTEPHYDGYPAVLVRLKAISKRALRALLIDAWRSQAPRTLASRYPDLR